MELRVKEDVRALFPALRIGVVTFAGLSIDSAHADAAAPFLDAAIAEAEGRVRATAADATALQSLPVIEAWREAYRRFGANPNRMRSSSEALLRRIVKGEPLRRIHPLVDLYNLATLQSHLPIGGYDLTTLRGDIVLRRSAGGEPFVGIGATAPEATTPGEVVYADDARVLTRSWNYRDADATKVAETSTDVALFIEAPVEAITDDRVRGVLEFLAERGATLFGATTKVSFLGPTDAAITF